MSELLSFDLEKYSSITQFWPLAILVLIVFAALSRRGGLRIIRVVRFFDKWLVKGLRTLTWIPAAHWKDPENVEPVWKMALRRLWFVAFFGLIFTGIFILPSGEDQPAAAAARMTIIVLGYLVALGVARTWVSEQSQILDSQDNMGSGSLANKLRLRAVFSICCLLFIIPLSFQAAHRDFQFFDTAKDYGVWEWGKVTINLLARAAVDFLELVAGYDSKDAISPADPRESAFLLTHFLVLSYAVVSGVSLIARGDHAMHADVARLSDTGKIGAVPRHGEQAIPELMNIVENPSAVSQEAVAAAIEALGEIRRIHHVGPSKVYRRIANALEHENNTVRMQAAIALGKWENPDAIDSLRQIVKNTQEMIMVRSAAVHGLADIGHLNPEHVKELVRVAIESIDPATPGTRYSLRMAVLDLFWERSTYLEIPGIQEVMKREWLPKEEHAQIANRIKDTIERPTQEKIDEGLAELKAPDPVRQAQGAQILSRYISDSRAVRALIHFVRSVEHDSHARAEGIRALCEKQNPEFPSFEIEITQCLRGRLGKRDEAIEVRVAAANGLSFFDPPAELSLRLLRSTARAQKENLLVRTVAALTLRNLGMLEPEDNKGVIGAIKGHVSDEKAKEDKSDVPVSGELQKGIEKVLQSLSANSPDSTDAEGNAVKIDYFELVKDQ